MRLRNWIAGAGVAATAALAATAGYAAPAVPSNAPANSIVEKAAYDCWYAGGVEQCRWVPETGYSYNSDSEPNVAYDDDWYPRDSYRIPPGTATWWDQVGRESGN